MKSKLWKFGVLAFVVFVVIGVDLLMTHLMMPDHKISSTLTPETYRLLVLKWFIAGLAIGTLATFFLVQSWVWRNWKSWNKFCCNHHEQVYRSTMGISQGKMLRR